jgi:hypothetical protein
MVAIQHHVIETKMLVGAIMNNFNRSVVYSDSNNEQEQDKDIESQLLNFIEKLKPNIEEIMAIEEIKQMVDPVNNKMSRIIIQNNPTMSLHDVYTCSLAFSLLMLWSIKNEEETT